MRFYATQFSLVEVDATYYALPARSNAERWVERTPPDFVFNVKAYAALTGHPIDVARLPKDLRASLPDRLSSRERLYPKDLPRECIDAIWSRFLDAIAPLSNAGKLGCVLMQYPPWFDATRGHAREIESCRERLGDVRGAVEFRHATWGQPERFARVTRLLADLGLSYVMVDEPQGTPHSMPPNVAVTTPGLAVIRFHGRRTETWDVGASVREKFDYLYAPEELRPWAPTVRQIAGDAEQVHLVFNNCVSDHAVLGAKNIMALLDELERAEPVRGT